MGGSYRSWILRAAQNRGGRSGGQGRSVRRNTEPEAPHGVREPEQLRGLQLELGGWKGLVGAPARAGLDAGRGAHTLSERLDFTLPAMGAQQGALWESC